MGFLFRDFRETLLPSDDVAALQRRDQRPVHNDTSRPENRLPTPRETYEMWKRKRDGKTADEGGEGRADDGTSQRTNEQIQSAYNGL